MAKRVTYVLASAVLMLAASTPAARAQEPVRVQALAAQLAVERLDERLDERIVLGLPGRERIP